MPLSKSDSRNLFMAYATVFLDTINYSLIIPILPFIVEELKASSMQSGILYSGYSIFQLISLTIAGAFSDIYGRKIFLILSLIGSCLGSIFQFLSRDINQLMFWRSLTGLFAGSNILVQAVIADLTTLEERNKYYSRLEALNSAAFILGPALAGILSKVSIFFPLLAAGIISGIALFFSFFFLKESNKDVIAVNEIKEKAKKATEDEKKKLQEEIKHRKDLIKLSRKQESPKVTKLMFLCFIFEFCNRWAVNAFDAKYGIFVNEKFHLDPSTYSIMICVQSCVTCGVQAFLYPIIVRRLPVSYLAVFGALLQTISYFFMSFSNNLWGSFIASSGMWLGFTFAVPTAVTIISTTNAPEVQGKVLSWNNLCCQASLIVCPLVLSGVYDINREAIYYFSMVFSIIACLVMTYVSTWPNAKTLGKQGNQEKKDIEMAEISTKNEDTENNLSPKKSESKLNDETPEKKEPEVVDTTLQEVKVSNCDTPTNN